MTTTSTSPLTIDLADQVTGTPLETDDLRDLMRTFNEATERLQRTHVTLRQEVARLQRELAEANAQLRRSRDLAALGEMAAGIAHEIRNPLASIQLYAQMLGEELAQSDDGSDVCRKISHAIVRLDGIVRDVLHFARRREVRPVETTGRDLFEQALAQCESMLANDSIVIDRSFDVNDADMLQADPVLLGQALSNVITNALQAMAEQGSDEQRLTVATACRRVRCPDGSSAPRVVLTVADIGPGMSSEVVARMFNPFFTTRATGTGLGLAIVHRIVDAHGGHINVQARPGKGTKVEICLPAVPPVDSTSFPPNPSPGEGRS